MLRAWKPEIIAVQGCQLPMLISQLTQKILGYLCALKQESHDCFSLQDPDMKIYYACLKTMFEHGKGLGGYLYNFSTVTVTDILHQNPLEYARLQEAGIPAALVNSIKVPLPPFEVCNPSILQTSHSMCLLGYPQYRLFIEQRANVLRRMY